jgi:hypothetical protein
VIKDYIICVEDNLVCDFCGKKKRGMLFGESPEIAACFCHDCVEEMERAVR